MRLRAPEMIAQSDWDDGLGGRFRIRCGEPMSRHSSWRCGGPADRYYEPADLAELAEFLRLVPDSEPLYWLGLGSNMLVRDGGLRGTVIATSPGLAGFAWVDDQRLYAECGAACARLAREAAARDRAGLAFFAGIPGTVGGALAMNAGALGSETWEYVESVETLDRGGCARRRGRAEYRAGYRQVDGPRDEWFAACVLHLPMAASRSGPDEIKRVLAQRAATQPTGKATCGSVFKNPPGDFAGRLIEHCGLKGYRQGACLISPVHANFIVNEGKASAAELERLISHVQAAVESATGVRLEPEVRIVGSPGTSDGHAGGAA